MHTSMLPDGQVAVMTPQQYENPPVHEIHLDVRFNEGVLSESELVGVREALGDEMGVPRRAEEFTIQAGLSPTLQVSSASTFTGWEYTLPTTTPQPQWILRTLRNQLSFIMARSEAWPRGDYVGWDLILEKFKQVCAQVEPVYGRLKPRRLAVRYINRIGVPDGTKVEDWFHVGPQGPDLLDGLHSFNLQTVWREIEGHESLSAVLRFTSIEIPSSAELPADTVGVLLDIEIFNLLVKNAPERFEEIPEWLVEAHEVENAVFEQCITPGLKAIFGRIEE